MGKSWMRSGTGAASERHSSAHSLRTLYESGTNNFNPIRLIAACAVIYGHAYAVVEGGGADFVTRYLGYGFTGGLAVDAFFLISGFLITASAEKRDYAFYIASRALRILPAWWLCLALTTFVFAPLLSDEYTLEAGWRYFYPMAFLLRTEFFIPGVFDSLPNQAVNGVLWSVIIEARMYVVTLILSLVGLLERRSLFNGLFFALLIGAFFFPDGVWLGTSPTDRHVMFFFMFGAFAWINRSAVRISPVRVVIALLILGAFHGTPKFAVVYMLVFPYLILACAFGPAWPSSSRIGDYSYGVYLWGWPIQQAILLVDPHMSATTNQLVAIPLALLVASVSWHFVEKPALDRKRALARQLAKLLPRRRHGAPTSTG